MKKNYVLFLMFFLVSYFLKGQIPSYVPTNGLIGYWPFSGNANDLTTNALNGQVQGAQLTTDRFNSNNNAYDFDHVNQAFGQHNKSIYIPYSPILNVNEITISLWVFLRSYTWSGNPYGSTLINRYENGYSNPNGQVWQISLDNSSISGIIMNPDGSPTSSSIPIPGTAKSNTPISLNQWHNIVLTYEGFTVKLYIDGVLTATKAFTSTMNISGNSGISIGESKQANGYWGNTDGKIDDIAIWNRALSSSEIATLYNNQSLSVNEFTNSNNLSFYPNPASDFLNIYSVLDDKLAIIDTSGRIIKEYNLKKGYNMIDISNLLNGLYFLKTESSMKKFIKK